MRKSKNFRQIPLFKMSLTAKSRKEVLDTLESGWLTTGPKVERFERAVAEYLSVKHAVAVSSCSIGLQMVLTALGASPGREVITSPFTFVGTIGAIMLTGARPVFADIDPDTLNIDPDEVAARMTDQTMAVLPVDIAGYPADYDKLGKLCNKHDLPLISDSAHSIGARFRKKSVAQLADAAVLSFYSTKNITCGEGGMVVSKHRELIDTIRVLSRHGLTSGTIQRKNARSWKYDAQHLGFKANLSDIHGAIGLGQISAVTKLQAAREKQAARYLKNLEEFSDLIEMPSPGKMIRHGWHLFIIKLKLSQFCIDRDEFILQMSRRGVECGVHYEPIFNLSYYRKALKLNAKEFPNAAYAGQRVVSLPLYPGLKLTDVDYVCDAIKSIVADYGR